MDRYWSGALHEQNDEPFAQALLIHKPLTRILILAHMAHLEVESAGTAAGPSVRSTATNAGSGLDEGEGLGHPVGIGAGLPVHTNHSQIARLSVSFW